MRKELIDDRVYLIFSVLLVFSPFLMFLFFFIYTKSSINQRIACQASFAFAMWFISLRVHMVFLLFSVARFVPQGIRHSRQVART